MFEIGLPFLYFSVQRRPTRQALASLFQPNLRVMFVKCGPTGVHASFVSFTKWGGGGAGQPMEKV